MVFVIGDALSRIWCSSKEREHEVQFVNLHAQHVLFSMVKRSDGDDLRTVCIFIHSQNVA
jgi:hypothetical protein